MHREKRERSIAKAVTYRLISIVLDSSIAYLVTQSAEKTLIFVIISNLISIMMYFIHERAWNRVHWGKHSVTFKK
jgi:adenylylsulfate kinase